jgi:3-dehydroquinate dehydratase/shikimate dehydrogenase
MICLTATQSSPEGAQKAIESSRSYIDMVELRLDFWDLSDPEVLERGTQVASGLPRILTLRRSSDGGGWSRDERKRVELLTVALERMRPEYVDLEDDLCRRPEGRELMELAASVGAKVVRSIHDFRGTPNDLCDRVLRLQEEPGDVAKYAVTTTNSRDLLILQRASDIAAREAAEKERVLLGMGPYGVPSRLLPSRFHSRWTYCSAPEAGTTPGAPGHLSPRELVERFAFREAERGDPLFAVLGDPVLHSGSPTYHNRRFREEGAPGAYIALPADEPRSAIALLDHLGFRGVSVTIPHKEGVLPFLERSEDAVRAMGATNTLLRTPSGGWEGRNTDVTGFLSPLRRKYPHLRDCRALVLGAGGAARAVVYALLREECRLVVANRTKMRGAALLEELKAAPERHRAVALNDPLLLQEPFDLIVQTTSVGMDGVSEPLPSLPLGPGQLVYEIIYTPPETPLILRAREAGASTITGDRMFHAQAEAQFDEFLRLARGG